MITELHDVYQVLNNYLFSNNLPLARFISSTARKPAFKLQYAHTPVIFVGCDVLKLSATNELFDELLHEQIHVYHVDQGVVDVTSNQYHNVEFRSKALKVGLYVYQDKSRGWGITTSKTFHSGKHKKPEKADFECRKHAYAMAQKKFPKKSLAALQKLVQEDVRPTKQYHYKYACQCDPPHIFRTGKKPGGDNEISVHCDYCGGKFVVENRKFSK